MRYNRFSHLSNLSRVQHLKEFLGIGTEYDGLVEQEQQLFGLEDWYIETMYAEDETLEDMRKDRLVAIIVPKPELERATMYFDEEAMGNPEYSQAEVVDHELAELIVNPHLSSNVFGTGCQLDDIKSTHIARACELLRREDPKTQVSPGDSLEEIVEKARYLTWLSENDWRIHTEETNKIEWGDERLPAFAFSNYYLNNMGLALFGAREIILKIDPAYIEENGLFLCKIILLELFRAVLNPYSKPDRTAVQERQLGHIMKAMVALGWGDEINGQDSQ